jgi:hypothetical protein
MQISQINQWLKYIMLVLLISLAILSVYYKYDNCSVCKFKINNSNYGANELMGLYSNKCLKSNSSFLNSFNQINFSKLNIKST